MDIRSERYWTELPHDLVIKQVVIQSLKTFGGLNGGTGMSDAQRAIWIFSKRLSLECGTKPEELTYVFYTTSEQH